MFNIEMYWKDEYDRSRLKRMFNIEIHWKSRQKRIVSDQELMKTLLTK